MKRPKGQQLFFVVPIGATIQTTNRACKKKCRTKTCNEKIEMTSRKKINRSVWLWRAKFWLLYMKELAKQASILRLFRDLGVVYLAR